MTVLFATAGQISVSTVASGATGQSTTSTTATSTPTTTTIPRCSATPVTLLRTLPPTTTQLVLVTAVRSSATVGVLTTYSKVGSCWQRHAVGVSAELGYFGLALHKHEGDGKTPEGMFTFGPTMYGTQGRVNSRFVYHHLVCGDWWDEQSGTAQYNQFVHVACGTQPPFGGGSEPLWAIQPQYTHFAVIDYNTGPILPGRGSAIFLHVSVGAPTAGCVAIAAQSLVTLLAWLNPADHPRIVISTTTRLSQW